MQSMSGDHLPSLRYVAPASEDGTGEKSPVFVWRYDGAAWQLEDFFDPIPLSQGFGLTKQVELDGDTLVITTPAGIPLPYPPGATNPGWVQVWERSGST